MLPQWKNILLCVAVCVSPSGAQTAYDGADIRPALQRMYNFDFAGAHKLIDGHLALHPDDPTLYWARAAAYLFSELDRLKILQSDFFESDKRISESKKLKADGAVRTKLFTALADCRSRAQAQIAAGQKGPLPLFDLAISYGIESDYLSLVEKRQIASFKPAKESQQYALQTLRQDPGFVDAKLTTGISEYLVGSLPVVVRWFVHFDGTQGDKKQAVANLTEVAARGIYLGPFARILLSIIAIREKRPEEARSLLTKLASDYPENPLFRREVAMLSAKPGT